MQVIYLDWNSYGITHPEAIKVLAKPGFANPASKHSLGQANKRKLLQLTNSLLQKLNLFDYQTTYTSSATEANFAVLNSYKRVYVSDVEHPSVRNCPHAQIVPVDVNGQIRMDELENLIKQHKNQRFLVSYMLANHETGIINDLEEVVNITKKYGGDFHTDCVQGFGRIDMDLQNIKADYITIAPYKCGGMIGIAALLHKIPVSFYWSCKRPGTIPIQLIEGFVKSLDFPKPSNKTLEENLIPSVQIIGKKLNRLPNTTCIVCKNKDELLMMLDLNNVYASSGAACSSDTADKAHSLAAMGILEDTIRISSGWSNTEQDMKICAEVINTFQ